jgi:hypothetical protein
VSNDDVRDVVTSLEALPWGLTMLAIHHVFVAGNGDFLAVVVHVLKSSCCCSLGGAGASIASRDGSSWWCVVVVSQTHINC